MVQGMTLRGKSVHAWEDGLSRICVFFLTSCLVTASLEEQGHTVFLHRSPNGLQDI